ncbi:MAG: GpE family phage tail protein, partial [Acinetobacter sp.]
IESLMSDISKNITAEHSLIYKILISMSVKINRYIGDDYEIDELMDWHERARARWETDSK